MNFAGLKFDNDFNPIEPTAVLTSRNGKKIGLIQKTEFRYKGNLSSADEISFSVQKQTVRPEVWNELKDFRLCWIREWDAYFEINVTTESTDSLVKKVTGTSLGEAELSQTNLYGVEINTEKEINNSDENYSPTVFYNPDDQEHSLMHRMLKRTCYKPGYVDECLRNEQRSFPFNDISIKDGFDQVAKELQCLFIYHNDTDEFGKINRVVDAYNLDTERKNADGTPAPVYGSDTGIFISDENIANRITLTTDVGNVKNCFKLEGGDDTMTAAIASCNPTGTSYLWYITDDMREIMSEGLRSALGAYDEKYKTITGNVIVVAGASFVESNVCAAYNEVIQNLAGEKYSQSSAYSAGDKVNRDGVAYCCKTDIAAGELWNDDKWEYVYGEHNAIFTEITMQSTARYDFNEAAEYSVGDMIAFHEQRGDDKYWMVRVYECIQDFCYNSLSEDIKVGNLPRVYTDYWKLREDLIFIDPFSDAELNIIDPDHSRDSIKFAFSENMTQLSEFLYNAIDVQLFLTDSMMPDYNIIEMNQSYLNSSINDVIIWFSSNSIGVIAGSTANMTSDMAKRAAEGMIKVLVDSRFRIEISDPVLVENSNPKQFTFTVTLSCVNKDGEDISSTSSAITMKLTEDYSDFIKQKIEKALSKKADSINTKELTHYRGEYTPGAAYEKDDVVTYDNGIYRCINEEGIASASGNEDALPSNNTEYWAKAKIYYNSVSELQNLYDCCESCLSVLVEQKAAGITDPSIDYISRYNELTQFILDLKNYRQEQANTVDSYITLLRSTIKKVHSKLNMEAYLGSENMTELISYRRESTYSNSNFISDGLTNNEITKRAALFFDDAVKEIYKSAERQHSISSDIRNLLLIKEFSSVRDQFVLGNWIREMLDGNVYKLRLVGYEISFSDITKMNVEFSDLIRSGDSVSDVKSILDKAKSVSSTYGYTARQADRGNAANEQLKEINKNGIDISDISVFGDNKSIQWTQGGFILREYNELTNTYSPTQLKLLATGIYSTTDNWETVTKLL